MRLLIEYDGRDLVFGEHSHNSSFHKSETSFDRLSFISNRHLHRKRSTI